MLGKLIQFKRVFYAFFLCIPIVALVYYYPRYLIQVFGEGSPWLGYLYTYGIGGLVFAFSVIWIFTRKKLPLRKREELIWLLMISLGLIFSFFMHGLWITLSLSFPIKF